MTADPARPDATAPRRGRRRVIVRVLALVLIVVVAYLGATLVQVVTSADSGVPPAADAIVVLGAAQYDGEPSPILAARLARASALYDAEIAPTVVVTGGRQDGDRFTEAYSGLTYLLAEGIPEESILVVTDGSDTWQSLVAAKRVMDDDTNSVVFVSDGYHAARLLAMSDDLGWRGEVSTVGGLDGFGHVVRETAVVAVGRLVGFDRLSRWSS